MKKGDKIDRKLDELIDELGLGSNDREEVTQTIKLFFGKLL